MCSFPRALILLIISSLINFNWKLFTSAFVLTDNDDEWSFKFKLNCAELNANVGRLLRLQ